MIALVDVATAANAAGSDTTIDITGVDVSGGNEVLYVAVVHGSISSSPQAATVVWDAAGANQTFPDDIALAANPARGIALWRLVAPTPGTNKTISITGLNNIIGEVAVAISLSGVDQTTPNDTIDIVESGGGGAVTTSSSGAVATAVGDWVISFASIGDATPNWAVTGTGQTIRGELANSVASNQGVAVADYRDGSSPQTMTWTHDSSTSVGLLTFNVNAAAGGGRASKNTRAFPLGRAYGINRGITGNL